MANPSTHKGHRERLKNRFLGTGLDSFTDVQALELLLFYAIPMKDTNPIAHALLNRFGSLSQVLDAPVEELKKVPGISDHAAVLLHLTTELARFYQVDSAQRVEVLTSLDALPSADDVQTTQRIAQALHAVDIVLIDHIVVAEGDYISMVQSGYTFEPGLLP